MKKLTVSLILSLMATQAFGAIVRSARLDASKNYILIDVTYIGGCSQHDFSLKLGSCLETFPVQCSAELIEKTDDQCEALIANTAVIPLDQYHLNDGYFKGASLKITGDLDWQTKKASQATVTLP